MKLIKDPAYSAATLPAHAEYTDFPRYGTRRSGVRGRRGRGVPPDRVSLESNRAAAMTRLHAGRGDPERRRRLRAEFEEHAKASVVREEAEVLAADRRNT